MYSLLIAVPKSKYKISPGCFLAEPVTQATRFSMLLEPSLGTIPLSSGPSQLGTFVCFSPYHFL